MLKFQGDDGADDDYDPSAERPSSDLEQELEPGEVSRKKSKNAAASPVKIALSAKSIKGGLISESLSLRIKAQKNGVKSLSST